MSIERYSKILKESSEVERLSKDKLKEFSSINEDSLNKSLPSVVDEVRSMIFQEIQEEVEKLKEEAFEKGFEEGKEQGLRILMEELERYRDFFKSFAKELEEKANKIIECLVPESVELSLKVASKVLSTYAEVDKDLVGRLIKEALARFTDLGSKEMRVKVNPEDLEFAERFFLELEQMDSVLNVKLEPCSDVAKGGCIIETPTEYIDNQVEMRFSLLQEEVKRKLLERGEKSA